MTVKALYHVHYKFLAIPAIFILLRVWTCIVNIALVYGAFANLQCDWLFVLILLSVSWYKLLNSSTVHIPFHVFVHVKYICIVYCACIPCLLQ